MGILIVFLIFIYRLKLKVKRLIMALTLDEMVGIVLLSGRQGWTQRQKMADEFNIFIVFIPVASLYKYIFISFPSTQQFYNH
jgi:hypothetical protein